MKNAFLLLKLVIVKSVFVVNISHCCVLSIIDIGHRRGHVRRQRGPVAAVSVVEVGHPCGLFVLNVGHYPSPLCCQRQPLYR